MTARCSSITSSMTARQFIIFSMIIASSLSSSFTVCLFPPFYPRIAEMKGATATDYGLIIVANALVITSTFTYTACEFPAAVAKIFSVTRCVMNVAQLGGPILGGLLYEAGGFAAPFVIFGGLQMLLSLAAFALMTSPEEPEGDLACDDHLKHKKKKNKVSVCAMLSI